MYVCVCRGITDKQIRRAVDEGARNMRDIGRSLGAATVCGKCGPCARDILIQRLQERAAESAAPTQSTAIFSAA